MACKIIFLVITILFAELSLFCFYKAINPEDDLTLYEIYCRKDIDKGIKYFILWIIFGFIDSIIAIYFLIYLV